jgi:ADP-ribose pyrophosphatase YjhB (NUDIX family)
MDVPKRRVARIVLLDAEDSVLMVRYDASLAEGVPFWVPPGGALEGGESHRDAGHRELLEETGLNEEIGRQLWERSFSFDLGGRRVHQEERYFLARTAGSAPSVSNTSPEDIKEHRWWTLADLMQTEETIYPEKFSADLKRVLEERYA